MQRRLVPNQDISALTRSGVVVTAAARPGKSSPMARNSRRPATPEVRAAAPAPALTRAAIGARAVSGSRAMPVPKASNMKPNQTQSTSGLTTSLKVAELSAKSTPPRVR